MIIETWRRHYAFEPRLSHAVARELKVLAPARSDARFGFPQAGLGPREPLRRSNLRDGCNEPRRRCPI
jgi:hypothetical protein